ncbi:MAG: single-stranded DNA exonuclease RecJ, partial [Candidatus Saccharimonadales bacterium]
DVHLIKGGGHKLAAGVTLQAENIAVWRKAVNQYYRDLQLSDQRRHLEVRSDVTLTEFSKCTEGSVVSLSRLEPYGHGNPEPVFEFSKLTVENRKTMGTEGQHVKYRFLDGRGQRMEMIAFNKAESFTAAMGDEVRVWCQLDINEWNGRRNVEGRLLRMDLVSL